MDLARVGMQVVENFEKVEELAPYQPRLRHLEEEKKSILGVSNETAADQLLMVRVKRTQSTSAAFTGCLVRDSDMQYQSKEPLRLLAILIVIGGAASTRQLLQDIDR
jgi:hypothetical protein